MTTKQERIAALDLAIERAGGIVKFCQRLKVTHQAVYSWKARGWVPPERAVMLEAVFGIPRTDTMNPDLVRTLSLPSTI
jgi:hypothetical protein